MRTVRRRLSSERGSVVVVVAVTLMAMLALAALAIDLAELRDTRGQAQRAADAIALAGASAFRDFPSNDPKAADSAQTRGLDIARLNMVRADTLDVRNPVVTTTTYAWGKVTVIQTQDVTLNVIPDSQKVRAWVRRQGVRTSFAKLLGRPFTHVRVMATAWASNAAPVVNCMKPFLIPDMWHESNKTTQDVNSNDYMDPGSTKPGKNPVPGEQWLYEPPSLGGTDYYVKYDPKATVDPAHPQTGYGSGRIGYTDDVGLPLLFKPQTGANQRQGNSYFTIDGPLPNLDQNITSGCINAAVGDTAKIWSSPGGQTGQATHGIRTLYDADPLATWDQTTKQVLGSSYPDWTKSPRVILVGLMDPIYIKGNSKNTKPDPNATFNNFARLFIKDRPVSNDDNLSAIFIGFAPGGSGGPLPGTLVKQLQLIQ